MIVNFLELTGDSISTGTATTKLSAGDILIDTNIFVRNTLASSVTAYATGISFVENKLGGGGYSLLGDPFITSESNSFPVTLKSNGASSTGSINVAVTAVGASCAQGDQTLQYVVTLSAYALSGAGVRVLLDSTTVAVLPAVTASCVYTPVYQHLPPTSVNMCAAELSRRRLLGYI